MTSISGNPNDPPRESVAPKPALDVAGYVARFVPSAVSVAPDEYAARLQVCSTCIYRTTGLLGFRCAACGCFIHIKATLRGFHCPRHYWPGDPPSPDSSFRGPL